MRAFLLGLGLFGFVLFGSAFVLSYLDPLLVERAAREVVRIEVERRVGEKVDALSNSRIAGLAQRVLRQTDAQIAQTQAAIRAEIPARVANAVADMLRADCECRKRLVEHARQVEDERLGALDQVRGRLTVLVESAYAHVTAQLMREFRIFAGSNAVAFGLLGLVTLLRRAPALQLLLPALVLVGAATITGGLYLFKQNWLHTLIYNDYLGLAYAADLALVALLLTDVMFNRARVSTRLMNAALTVVGAAVSAVPC